AFALLLTVGMFGLGAGMYAYWSPAPRGAAQPPPGGQEQQPAPKKVFANADGYTWFHQPEDIREHLKLLPVNRDIWGYSIADGGEDKGAIVTLVLLEGASGELVIVQNETKFQEDPVVEFRPVVLDAAGKRYLL